MLTMCTKTTIHCCLFTAASASVFVINYNYLHPQKLTKQETVLKLKCLDNTKIKITKFWNSVTKLEKENLKQLCANFAQKSATRKLSCTVLSATFSDPQTVYWTS